MLLDHDFEGNLNAIGIYGINLEVSCVLGVPALLVQRFFLNLKQAAGVRFYVSNKLFSEGPTCSGNVRWYFKIL